jgi:hypothetical protein
VEKMNWLVKVAIWLFLPRHDKSIFWEACKLASMQIKEQDDTEYYGGTKHAIAYERIRTILVKNGYQKSDITGAVIHMAIALRYLQSIR